MCEVTGQYPLTTVCTGLAITVWAVYPFYVVEYIQLEARCTASHGTSPCHLLTPPHPTVPITLVATSTNRMEPADLIEPVSDSASRERNRRRRSRHRDLHRRRSRSRSHRRRPLGRRARPILASDHRIAVPKPPPAVKAMPACRPSGLSYGR